MTENNVPDATHKAIHEEMDKTILEALEYIVALVQIAETKSLAGKLPLPPTELAPLLDALRGVPESERLKTVAAFFKRMKSAEK